MAIIFALLLFFNYLVINNYNHPILTMFFVVAVYIVMAYVAYQSQSTYYSVYKKSNKGKEEWNKHLDDFINNNSDDDK